MTKQTYDLLCFLGKLGIKSAEKKSRFVWGNTLKVESLEGTMRNVTFDMKNLTLWPNIKLDD